MLELRHYGYLCKACSSYKNSDGKRSVFRGLWNYEIGKTKIWRWFCRFAVSLEECVLNCITLQTFLRRNGTDICNSTVTGRNYRELYTLKTFIRKKILNCIALQSQENIKSQSSTNSHRKTWYRTAKLYNLRKELY